ncbi:HAD-IB family phosphatase [Candidatus Phycosocius spiralis]|uniref:Protein CicA n=1 Tax=Candidatus Phycosocius spiralis TaxID=2815099 RepID=A0ABQ4PWF9_9PROT|nr:HAD-IB family phosphatase [Candidatus Phycosocius spiralis]GIU67394.1 protein CicA [Candidatus Phycosocius spiralis]
MMTYDHGPSLAPDTSPVVPGMATRAIPTPSTVAPIAAFDVDGTLTWADSFSLFLRFVAGRWGFLLKMARLVPDFVAYSFGMMPRAGLKEKIIHAFLGGMKAAHYHHLCADFARFIYPLIARPDALARLRAHQGIHDQVVLVSASLQDYLACWAADLGVPAVLATRVEVVAGLLTGRLDGPNCWGPQKLVAIQGAYGQTFLAAAYGDTRGDKEMLEGAQNQGYRIFQERPRNYQSQILSLYLGNQIERWRANQG